MLCTKCSEPVKPVVSIDIDGTLGEYHEHFLIFASSYLQQTLRLDYRGPSEMHEFMGIDLELYRDIKLAYRQGGLKRSMQPLPGAVPFMHEVREMGYEIWIATTRPYLRLDNIDPDTRFWLQHNGIPFDGLIYGDDKYRQLATAIQPSRVHMILDDLPEQAELASDWFASHTPYVISRPHNEYYRRRKLQGYNEALEVLQIRSKTWQVN